MVSINPAGDTVTCGETGSTGGAGSAGACVALKRGGVVKSFRGAQGGYTLAAAPQDLRLLDVMTLLEGPVNITPGGRGDARLQGLWHDLAQGARDRLDRSILELMDEIRAAQNRLDYTI